MARVPPDICELLDNVRLELLCTLDRILEPGALGAETPGGFIMLSAEVGFMGLKFCAPALVALTAVVIGEEPPDKGFIPACLLASALPASPPDIAPAG